MRKHLGQLQEPPQPQFRQRKQRGKEVAQSEKEAKNTRRRKKNHIENLNKKVVARVL